MNGDGRLDLVTPNIRSNDVSVLLGNGDGTFAAQRRFAVGDTPSTVAVADVNGDGQLDLVTNNEYSDDVSVLLGNGDGAFAAQQPFAVGDKPRSVAVADVNGDGRLDLVTLNLISNDLSVLLGKGDGTFSAQQRFAVGDGPGTLDVVDVNGDGRLDLVTANLVSDEVSVLLGNGAGSFAAQQRFAVGKGPRTLAVTDVNGDKRLDLVTANSSDDVSVLLGNGAGSFQKSQLNPFGTPDSSPVFARINGDAVPDALVLDGAGQILLRRGLANQPGRFTAPTILNPNDDNAALDAVVVRSLNAAGEARIYVAAVNKLDNDLTALTDGVSIYSVNAAGVGTLVSTIKQPDSARAVRIASADFNADGRGDLAVVNAGNSTVTIYRGLANGTFQLVTELPIGAGQSEIELSNFDGRGGIDILVSSGTSGDVSIFLNNGAAAFTAANFTTAGHFRAGFGLEGLEQANDGTSFVHSLAETGGLAIDDFFEDGSPNTPDILDVVAMNANYRSFTALQGTGHGTVVNATDNSPRTLTGAASTLIHSGQFDAANTPLDVAVLNPDEQTITIFLGNGNGTFTELFTTNAGIEPSGFSVADVNNDARPDVLVGNEDGDLLILFGQGDGTFAPPRPTGQSIPLVVTDLDGVGGEDFVFASESLDQVSVAFNQLTPTAVVQNSRNGLLAPDAVLLTDLNGDGILFPDLVVANSGGNNVIVYLGGRVDENGDHVVDALDPLRFGQAANSIYSFKVATAPAALTTAGDLNGDGLTDLLVAHRGSNVVKLLLSDASGSGFSMTNHLTFTMSGLGPTSILLKDVMKADGSAGTDGFDDLLVTNSQAAPGSRNGSIDVFASNGANGFFDASPNSTTPVGGLPIDIVDLGDRLATVNFGSNSLSILSGFDGKTFQRTEIATFGDGPSSAVSGVDESGNDFLIVGSSDGILELFLDDGGELLSQGIVDSNLNPSAMALSVIQGSRVFYVTSEGKEQAFAFSLDDFAKPSDETVADLPSDSVAIIAALVAGSSDVSAADSFGGADGETVNFGELLFFSENGGAPTGAGGGDSASEVLEQLRHVAQRFVQGWAVTLGTSEGTGWQVIVSAVRSVLDTVGAVEVAGFNPFAGWQTVVVHLQLPGIGEALVRSVASAGQAMLAAGPVATGVPGEAALRDLVFGSSLPVPFDGFESLPVTDETKVGSQNDELLLPAEAMSRWWVLPVERQAEELLLAGLLAATLWRPQPSRERSPNGDVARPALARNLGD